ncbi:MAG: glycerophosphodiester phosphodiesterase family protein [Sneathiella sp.]|uniref:glycerophosphodiester phosphodiesterase family protein n=1 Tax=Sneathiella sp. TaxID=1964365 RepID=UPI003001AA7A
MLRLALTILCAISFSASVSAEPLIIAHRGGASDWPENTLLAFQESKDIGVDAIELDVQLTRDGIPVVFHSPDLSRTTNGVGAIGNKNLKYIKSLNAGWNFAAERQYPYRRYNLEIPTLAEVLTQVSDIPLIIDLKSLPAKPLIKALVDTIDEKQWSRLVFYSTNSEHLKSFHRFKPDAVTFEDRSISRKRLLAVANQQVCLHNSASLWIGFELNRTMVVTEKFVLGSGQTTLDFHLWTPKSVECTRQKAPGAKIVLFGINTEKDYRIAEKLGVDAMYTDSPRQILRMQPTNQ